MAAAIVDVKFRFKVIRHLMSNSVSKMPSFVGFWVIFLWGRDFLTFRGALLNYTHTGYYVKV